MVFIGFLLRFRVHIIQLNQVSEGIGSRFLPWQHLGIGMPWRNFQRRKGLRCYTF
ncbi:hypothetical protein HanRHA438_Chr15g0728811 [Helianthus annuus]|nr:hypothetical protein HanRHA438_Chr15g0728811 [Helianthus annuus]